MTLGDLLNKLKRKQTKSLLSVTCATVVNNVVGFAVNLIAARTLGKADFGVFSLAFAVTSMTAAIGEFGLNLTMIRLFNKYEKEPQRQAALLGSVLVLKICVLLLISLIALPFGSVFAQGMGLGAVERMLFAVALVTGGLLLGWTYLQACLQSHRSFRRLTAFILAYAGLRVAFLAIAYTLWPRSPLAWLVATYALPAVLVSVGGLLPEMRVVWQATVKNARVSIGLLWEALNYSKWVALSSIAYISLLGIVRFILSAKASLAEVGVFSAGITFAMAFSTLNTAIRAVLFPQITALAGPQQMNQYLSRLRRLAPYYGVAVLLAVGLLAALQWFVLGDEYRAALPVFLVTSSAVCIAVFLGLGTMLVHTMMKPHIDACVNAARLAVMVLLAIVLIPSLRALGAAIAYAVPVMAGELWMFRYVKRENRRRPSE